MLITATRRPGRVAPSLQTRIDQTLALVTSASSDAALDFDYVWPRCDMLLWAPVLNQIDTRLVQIDPQIEQLLQLSLKLWDNTTNRTVYASLDKLLALLQSDNLTVVELALTLISKIAARSKNKMLGSHQQTLLLLARRFSSIFSYYADNEGHLVQLQINAETSLESLPEPQRLELSFQLRKVRHASELVDSVRFLAMAVLAQIFDADTAASKLFVLEIDLIPLLVSHVTSCHHKVFLIDAESAILCACLSRSPFTLSLTPQRDDICLERWG